MFLYSYNTWKRMALEASHIQVTKGRIKDKVDWSMWYGLVDPEPSKTGTLTLFFQQGLYLKYNNLIISNHNLNVSVRSVYVCVLFSSKQSCQVQNVLFGALQAFFKQAVSVAFPPDWSSSHKEDGCKSPNRHSCSQMFAWLTQEPRVF